MGILEASTIIGAIAFGIVLTKTPILAWVYKVVRITLWVAVLSLASIGLITLVVVFTRL